MKGTSKKLGVCILSMVFLLALVSAMPVQAKTPLRWEYAAIQTFDPLWTGDIVRDDGVSGTIILDVYWWVDLNNVEHFSGIWSITWDGGEYIKGTQAGKVVFSTGEYVINGQVTETSDNWDYLSGRHVHIMGSIDYSTWPLTTNGVFQIN